MAKKHLNCPVCGHTDFAVRGVIYVEMPGWFEGTEDDADLHYKIDPWEWEVDPEHVKIQCNGCENYFNEYLEKIPNPYEALHSDE